VLLAQATGTPVACDDGTVLPAVEQVARDSSCKERRQAAEAVVERIYGKAPATIEVEAHAGDAFLDAVIRLAHPRREEALTNGADSNTEGEDRGGA
jgi:hypothetical protein